MTGKKEKDEFKRQINNIKIKLTVSLANEHIKPDIETVCALIGLGVRIALERLNGSPSRIHELFDRILLTEVSELPELRQTVDEINQFLQDLEKEILKNMSES